jgi:hypothetical protein
LNLVVASCRPAYLLWSGTARHSMPEELRAHQSVRYCSLYSRFPLSVAPAIRPGICCGIQDQGGWFRLAHCFEGLP